MPNWKEYKLGDITEFISRGVTPAYSDSGVIVINQKCIRNGKVSYEESRFTDVSKKKIPPDKYLKSLDILINSTGQGTLGRVGQVKEIVTETTVDSHVTIVRASEMANPIYLGYVLKSKQSFIENLAEGTTGQTELSRHKVAEIEIALPDLPTQTAIAEILSSLDDKIELNNQINKELEALAQALFKNWFIDFEFPNENGQPYKSSGGEMVESELGEIPKGWSVEPLQNMLEVKYGKDHKHLNEGSIPVYGSGGVMRYADQALYKNHSILIPRKGTLSNLFYVSNPFWSVDTMFYSIIKEDYLRKYLYYTIKSLDLASMNVGSAVPSMTTKVLNELKVIKPSTDILSKFENVISSTFEYSDDLRSENHQLKSLRDSLLPKLISGELEVYEALTEKVM